MRSSSPTQDGRYLLLDSVGRGATASVMRAFDRVDQRLVALKLFHRSRTGNARRSAAAEFSACCKVRHHGVVELYEMGRSRRGPLPPGLPYIVMQWVDGLPLDRAIRPGHVSDSQLTQIATQVLLALCSVHDAGLVHRDVTPANLLASVGDDDRLRVVLTDFGLATAVGRPTNVGRVSGTFRQISPEAICGAPLDGRADLYALGLVLAFLATGGQPCPADPSAALAWHLRGAALDLRGCGLSPRLRRLIESLTRREPAQRPRGAREALVTLGLPRAQIPAAATPGRQDAVSGVGDLGPLTGRRIVALPRDANARARAVRAARSLAETNGIPFHHWTDDADGLRRLALRLALLDLDQARERVARYRLDKAIGLGWVGDVPMLFEAPSPEQTRLASRRIALYILEFVRTGMLVVALEGATAEPGRALLREATRRLGPDPGAGGFLLLFDPSVTDRCWRSPSPTPHTVPTH